METHEGDVAIVSRRNILTGAVAVSVAETESRGAMSADGIAGRTGGEPADLPPPHAASANAAIVKRTPGYGVIVGSPGGGERRIPQASTGHTNTFITTVLTTAP